MGHVGFSRIHVRIQSSQNPWLHSSEYALFTSVIHTGHSMSSLLVNTISWNMSIRKSVGILRLAKLCNFAHSDSAKSIPMSSSFIILLNILKKLSITIGVSVTDLCIDQSYIQLWGRWCLQTVRSTPYASCVYLPLNLHLFLFRVIPLH